jgi:hypothetical protein
VTLAAKFPEVADRSPHYESIYLVASHPTEPLAVWIRYTVHKAPGRPASGSVWFTLFDAGAPTATKVTDAHLHTDADRLLAVGGFGAVRRDGADGDITGERVHASWDLHFDQTEVELRHLPYEWMYRARVPRTKSTSPYPSMRVSGVVTVAGRELELRGWQGMLGHNWGAEHAHRWIWLRGASFADHPEAWLDVVIGRIKVGPVVLPWIANGAVVLDGPGGRRWRVGGLRHPATVRERPEGCDLVIPGRRVALAVRVTAPLATSVGWEYADPAGHRHQVRNCSVAGVAVDVDVSPTDPGSGHMAQRLTTDHGGVYELGTADFDAAVTMQPYRDG